jgi:hypothetical protein
MTNLKEFEQKPNNTINKKELPNVEDNDKSIL